MHRIKRIAIAFALLAYGAGASAAESASAGIRRDAPKGITEAFYACIDKADSDDIAEAACSSAEEGAQDARLNRTYKALLTKLDDAAKQQLIRSERAWLEFHHETAKLDVALYGKDLVGSLQVSRNEIFRLCERANILDDYLSLASDQ